MMGAMDITYPSGSRPDVFPSAQSTPAPRGLLDAVRQETSHYTHLAWLIVAVGLCGILFPLLFASGHPISYLRSSEHGAGSPTTQTSANAVQPEHLYRNQAQPRTDLNDPQVTRPIPESGDPIGAAP
jgi:hypothetical protein